MRVLIIMGTRPEAVKLAPVIHALDAADGFEPVVVSTGQHREMLSQIIDAFGLRIDMTADIFSPGQTVASLLTSAVSGLERLVAEASADLVLVQGDTTTTFAGALAGFYADLPVVHLEAGLRTGDVRAPFPEEMNRRLTTQLTTLHLAATAENRDVLIAENVRPEAIVVTGNTVIDALLWAASLPPTGIPSEVEDVMLSDERVVLVTAHRRESWGEPMREIARALRAVALRNPDVKFVFPMHRNPVVRRDLLPLLGGVDNVVMSEPIPYVGFAHLIARSSLVVTDSGGIQEEAPSLGKPVLVTRNETERHEAIAAGTARLVGVDAAVISAQIQRLIDDAAEYEAMARAVNPYGDGVAAARVVGALRWRFQDAPMPDEFRVRTLLREAS